MKQIVVVAALVVAFNAQAVEPVGIYSKCAGNQDCLKANAILLLSKYKTAEAAQDAKMQQIAQHKDGARLDKLRAAYDEDIQFLKNDGVLIATVEQVVESNRGEVNRRIDAQMSEFPPELKQQLRQRLEANIAAGKGRTYQ